PNSSPSSVPPEAMQTLQLWQRYLRDNPHTLTGSQPPPPASDEELKALDAEFKNLFTAVFANAGQEVPHNEASSSPSAAADTPFESVKQIRKVRPIVSNMLKLFTEMHAQPAPEGEKSSPDEALALKQLIQCLTGGMLDEAFKTVAQEQTGPNQERVAA